MDTKQTESGDVGGAATDLTPQRQELQQRAKAAAQALKQLEASTYELEQAALFPEPEFEEACLWPEEKIRKQYTGEHSTQILWRRNTAVYMLRIGCPKEHIGALLHMNHRLVEALACEAVKAVAQFSEQYANDLLAMSAEFFAHARLRMNDANTLQAATAGGILADKAMAIRSMGAGSLDVSEVVNGESENPALVSARKRLAERNGNLTAENAENT